MLIDPTAESRKLSEKIKKKGGKELKAVKQNLVDIVWGQSKPSRPNEKVNALDIKFAGKKFQDKLEDLRKELDKKKVAGLVICKFILTRSSTTPNACL
jgi:Xaa-Pro aminopeptidase